jgi:hypothetical protein
MRTHNGCDIWQILGQWLVRKSYVAQLGASTKAKFMRSRCDPLLRMGMDVSGRSDSLNRRTVPTPLGVCVSL